MHTVGVKCGGLRCKLRMCLVTNSGVWRPLSCHSSELQTFMLPGQRHTAEGNNGNKHVNNENTSSRVKV